MALTVEDIMCDQQIISSNCNLFLEDNDNFLEETSRKLWLQNFIYIVKNQFVPTLTAFFANTIAPSFQRIPKSLPAGVIKIRLRRVSNKTKKLSPIEENLEIKKADDEEEEGNEEKCVNCTVLHEPKGEIFGDVIFIHGLHGGIDRTWKQGTWRLNNSKFKNSAPIPKNSSAEHFYVPINTEDVRPQEGRLKRTLTKIYTTIPVKIARRTKEPNIINNNVEEKWAKIVDQEEEIINEEIDEENFSRCWPKDWLPEDCPGVRILAINYTTDVLWRPLWQKMKKRTTLVERSKEMMDQLLALGVGSRPILWVGHSKGGLYIKQILLNGRFANEEATDDDDDDDDIKNLYNETKGIMFYSVPHKGSPIADMNIPFFRKSIEVTEVQTDSEFVLNLHQKFLNLFKTTDINNNNNNRPEIFSFIDTENTPIGLGTSWKFITYESADPDIGIKCDVPLNHREICKPAGKDCFLYLELVKLIQRTIFNANNIC